LGVTTVLTITTLLSSANANLPPTAYPKSIGVFLAGCFVFTFFAFLEYSAASYLERRRALGKIKAVSAAMAEDSSEARTIRRSSPPKTNHLAPPAVNKSRRFTLAGVRDPMGLRPSAVDVYSRLLFPAAFVLFHMIYWSYSLFSLEELPEDVILLHDDQHE
jgi:gamma-aminobutyric acid receptor subunit rho